MYLIFQKLTNYVGLMIIVLLATTSSGCAQKQENKDPKPLDQYFADANKGNMDAAIDDLNKVIAANPNFADAYVQRGTIYWDQKKNYQQTIQDFNKALELEPNNEKFRKLYSLLGLAYLMLNNYQEAIENMSHAILDNQDVKQNYNNRCYCFDQLKQYAQALNDCNSAIEIDPTDADSYDTRAGVYLHQRNFEKSWADVHQVMELGGNVTEENLEELKKELKKESGRTN